MAEPPPRTGSDVYWNHNYFMVQEDTGEPAHQKFSLIPWDLDGTWPDLHAAAESYAGGALGGRPDWDVPVASCTEFTGAGPAQGGAAGRLGRFPQPIGLARHFPSIIILWACRALSSRGTAALGNGSDVRDEPAGRAGVLQGRARLRARAARGVHGGGRAAARGPARAVPALGQARPLARRDRAVHGRFRARPGPSSAALAFPTVKRLAVAGLYGRAGRLTATIGKFR